MGEDRSIARDLPFLVKTILFLLLLAVANGDGAAAAQTSRALEGRVCDSSGASIPRATVELRRPLTNQTRTLGTDDSGLFRAEEVAVGEYEILIEHPGFTP
jgi:hypothetical protein